MKTKFENYYPTQYEQQKNKGFSIKWRTPDHKGEAKFFDDYSYGSKDMPHPDLTTAWQALSTILLTMLNVSIPEPEEDERETTVTIKRLDISGEEDLEAVKITATFNHINGQKSNVSTPFVKLNEQNFGIEEDLIDILYTLKKETYEYAMNHKRAQLTIFEDDQD